ncbi:hypothetical protein QQO71_00520, partial [Clostridioides difficile]|uniref:hypothetical protein n=2 Tax=Clostridioides difficile TaxID=1496 RepID=UPI001CA4EED1
NHRYFIDPRPVGYATHLWIVFDRRYMFINYYGIFQPSLPSFKHSEFPHSMLVGGSGQAFQSVTSSFHLSDYQFS